MPEDEDDVYDEERREEAVEDGEITPEEAGFMQGYEEASKGKSKAKELEEKESED